MLTSLKFNGSIEQWNIVKKVGAWNLKSSLTRVICTDGTVSLA